MSKYLVGNRVRLRGDLIIGKYYGNFYVNVPIAHACGEWLTISSIGEDNASYTVEELSSLTYITDQMIDSDAISSIEQSEKKKLVCEICGKELQYDESHFIEGKVYCHECFKEIRDSIGSYHSKNMWNKRYGMAKPRLFNILMGFELEVESENDISDFQKCW